MNRLRLGLLALLIVIAAVVAFRGAGRWLTREDPLTQADAIFVLSGSMPLPRRGSCQSFCPGLRSRGLAEPARQSCQQTAEAWDSLCGGRGVQPRHPYPQRRARCRHSRSSGHGCEHRGGSGRSGTGNAAGWKAHGNPGHVAATHPAGGGFVAGSLRGIIRRRQCARPMKIHLALTTGGGIHEISFGVVRELLGLANAWAGLPVPAHSK